MLCLVDDLCAARWPAGRQPHRHRAGRRGHRDRQCSRLVAALAASWRIR